MSSNGVGAPAPNLFGLTQYDGQTTFFGGAVPANPLGQGVGWAILIGFAGLFFFIAAFLVWCDKKFAGANYNNEQFNTAGRTIGAGLIAVDVVSHWTWASIILGTGTYVWFYGAGSGMWFGTGSGTMTVWLFCVVAIELKHRAPKAHTFLEIIKLRWGTSNHIIFMCAAIFTNTMVSLQMMQSAVVVINVVTGVNIYASSFVLPLGVAAYAITGGLKATFTTSYLHTILIFVVGLLFMFLVFVNTDKGLGSIDVIYERLVVLGENYPIGGNKHGSYLTGWSLGSFEINIIYVLSCFSVMFVDQSYWQSAVAASPEGAVNGYAIGSYLYLGIVFMLPMGLGLGGLALDLPININEVYDNLVLPACAYALLGKAGVVLITSTLFMAVTSGGAGEMLAVSSLFTFDVWREYIRPQASGKELVLVSRLTVFVWSVWMGGLLAILNAANVDVYWLGIWTAVITSGAVFPVIYLISWDRCTGFAAGWCGALFGAVGGLVTWLVYPAIIYDSVSLDTTQRNGSVLVASGICLGIGIVMPVIVTLLTTKRTDPVFDWTVFDEITFTDAESTGIEDKDRAFIAKYRKLIWIGAIIAFILAEVVWPALTLPAGANWSKPYFRFMIVLAFMIAITSSCIAIFLPLWEGRHEAIDLVNWCLRRNVKPYGPQKRMIPDGIPPPDADYDYKVNGKADAEKAVLYSAANGDDSAHGGKAIRTA